jgi:putative redox protein
MGQSVTCSSLENYQMLVRTPTHAWVADRAAAKGGDGMGPEPFEHLVAALGTCIVLTMKIYAENRKIPLEKVWVDLNTHWEKHDGKEQFHIQVDTRVRGELTEPHLKRLERVVPACPAHKLLVDSAVIHHSFRQV